MSVFLASICTWDFSEDPLKLNYRLSVHACAALIRFYHFICSPHLLLSDAK